ncbi:hypothetical protein O6H91_Y186300 [Diphasiastrum complanatum]|nr:hypothetical protein O6H91_Y186300 [Diphasiastrum complanatum]KAJ7295460.1 hypothetical protein O6H91_Y186300 [Diphasiastrum complanatum]
MTMESFATPYPVIFHDGEMEHDKGHVGVHSVLSFKRFQSQMSRLIGAPANQLSTVFVCRRTLKDTEKRQKLPINETTNFNIILNQHNPSKERDCHFLVSIKKSKKERKGTRKRTSEADNADDEDSTSSRGGASPSDERPEPGITMDKSFASEATSPTSILQRPVSPALSSSERVEEQISLGMSSSAKNSIGSGDKVERILLRREGVGQNSFVSPRLGWPGPGQRVEGFNVNSVEGFNANNAGSTGEFVFTQSPQRPATIQDDLWRTEKAWMQDGVAGRQSEKMVLQAMQPPSIMSSVSRAELYRQGRFTDSTASQGFGMRPPTTLQRLGIVNRPRQPPFADIPARPIFSSFEGSGNIIPRNATAMPTPLTVNTGFHQAQLHSLMLQMQTPYKSFPAIASPGMHNSNPGVYGLGQVNTDLRADTQVRTYHCGRCSEKNQGPVPFHFCVNDRITTGFRGPSPAGPIARPSKRQLEAAA